MQMRMRTIMWALTGSLLSMTLPGCAALRADVPPPAPVAVAVEPPRPSAELLACADRPAALAEDPGLAATIPGLWRNGFIRLARAAGANADQLDRLINWISPGTCPAKE